MIIDGLALSKKLKEEQAAVVRELGERGLVPSLSVILVGEDEASKIYVRNKQRACEECGIKSNTILLPTETTTEELLELIETLNRDVNCNGILVQLPLPKQINEDKCLDAILPEKDVDGFHPVNVGNLLIGKKCLTPCTPTGVIEMIKTVCPNMSGKNAVVLGRSNIVGKPVAAMLLRENATVTVCHSKTADLAVETSRADILVVAIGKPRFVTADMVKEGAIVIDVGINRVDGKVCGDVDFDEVSKKAAFISPVPKGVGPMTIAELIKNTVTAAKHQRGIE